MTRFGLWPVIGRVAVAVAAALTVAVVFDVPVQVQGGKTMTTEDDFRRAFKDCPTGDGGSGRRTRCGEPDHAGQAQGGGGAGARGSGDFDGARHLPGGRPRPGPSAAHARRRAPGRRLGRVCVHRDLSWVDLQPPGCHQLPSDARWEGLQRPDRGRHQRRRRLPEGRHLRSRMAW